MQTTAPLTLTLLPGARELLALHARELPQRDDLCGAFCGALALRAAGIARRDGQPVDQDEVALAAGSVVARVPSGSLPRGEKGRRDYRLAIPLIDDAERSGTTAAGLVGAISELAGGRLDAVPLTGSWTPGALAGLFEQLAASEEPAALVVNIATRLLWGSRASAAELLGYLLDGALAGPQPDWDVGHFACVVGRLSGPGGALYALADTYPSLGSRGVHLQPAERLASALLRPQMSAGGAIAVVAPATAAGVRARADALGLREGAWDNGTIALQTPA